MLISPNTKNHNSILRKGHSQFLMSPNTLMLQRRSTKVNRKVDGNFGLDVSINSTNTRIPSKLNQQVDRFNKLVNVRQIHHHLEVIPKESDTEEQRKGRLLIGIESSQLTQKYWRYVHA